MHEHRSPSTESNHGGTSDYIEGLMAAHQEHEAALKAVRQAAGSVALGAEVSYQTAQ